MSKERMITRTITTHVVKVKVYSELLDSVNEEYFRMPVNYTRKDLDAKAALMGYVVLKILDDVVDERLYSMTEELFMTYGTWVIPAAKTE